MAGKTSGSLTDLEHGRGAYNPAMMRSVVVFFLLCLTVLPGCFLCSPTVRVATFNTALSRGVEGQLHAALSTDHDEQAKLVAEVLQRTRPDVVLLQEVDYDATGQAYEDFQRNYLSVSQNGAKPIEYAYFYAPPVNTGVLAEVDLDGDGKITRPNDCHGYGLFDGQFGMVVLSRFSIAIDEIEEKYDLRMKVWGSLEDSNMPSEYYTPQARQHLRLSSKTHVDLPIRIDGKYVRLFISHPTPPVFDGPEDRNGLRNRDEIWLWEKYIHKGTFNPLTAWSFSGDRDADERFYSWLSNFIVIGDLNADPNDGESRRDALLPLFNPQNGLQDPKPRSLGAVEAAREQGGKNLTHRSDPLTDTADFGDGDRGPGNLRVDYVLPSIFLDVMGSGVYWPTKDDPHAYLNKASDHKLVWIDIRLP